MNRVKFDEMETEDQLRKLDIGKESDEDCEMINTNSNEMTSALTNDRESTYS